MYPSREAAARKAWTLRAIHGGDPVTPYRCGVCHRWHLFNPRKRAKWKATKKQARRRA